MMKQPLRTTIIGSGNVASAIAPALERSGSITVETVFSPTPEHAAALASRLDSAVAVSDSAAIPKDSELYLLSVKDDAIKELARRLEPVESALWLHTSGGVEASALMPLSPRYGVFYPLQTFSKGVDVAMEEVPFFIETSMADDLTLVEEMARNVSPKVYHADGKMRARMHAAAVFACNFTNHLWAVADDILRRETGTDLSVLYPLLEETLRKAMKMRPAEAQTGPAVRGDRGVIERHAAMLADDEATLY
ncbi:MAG: DUF2520 domain-containing protein, partial [Paramuribaculum sp.]|nr:DUF2520 domain-containing protein [Paramuribaculum sp.]